MINKIIWKLNKVWLEKYACAVILTESENEYLGVANWWSSADQDIYRVCKYVYGLNFAQNILEKSALAQISPIVAIIKLI